MSKALLRRTLSAPGLLRLVRGCFERNFGHGERHLATAFAMLTVLATMRTGAYVVVAGSDPDPVVLSIGGLPT